MTLQDYKQWLGGFLEGKKGSTLTQEDINTIQAKLELVIPYIHIQEYPQTFPIPQPLVYPPITPTVPDITYTDKTEIIS